MKACMIVSFAILVCASTASADWRWFGPPAGSIEELAPDRSNPSLWFAVNNGSLYRSTDSARTWTTTRLRDVGYQGLGDGGYLKGSSVTVTAGRVIVLKKSAHESATEVWISRDRGRSFQRVADAPFLITKVIGDPADPDTLYAAADSSRGILVSRNEGKTWSEFSNLPLPQSNHGSCREEGVEEADVALSPFDSSQIFVTGLLNFRCGPESDYEEFFFKSIDAGKSWKPELKDAIVQFKVDRAYPERLLAIHGANLIVLTLQGWQTLSSDLQLQDVISVPRHPQELLAQSWDLTRRQIRSTDFGHTWHNLNLDLKGRIEILASLDDSFRGLLAGTDGGGLYVRNEKHPWIGASAGFRESRIADVQGKSSLLYGLEKGNFLFRNTGSGWTNLTPGIPGGSPFGIGVDTRDPKHIVALSTGIAASNDGGTRWTQSILNGGFKLLGPVVTIDPTNSQIVYASKLNSFGLFKSVDGGKTFQTLTPKFTSTGFRDMVKILVDSNDHRIVYFVIPYYGFFKSVNGGASVTKVNKGISPPCPECQSSPGIDLLPLAPVDSYLAITTQGKLYRTSNGAQQWELIGQGPAHESVSHLYSADGMGRHLYCIAGLNPKLFESNDSGKTWIRINEFPPDTQVYSLSDPKAVPLFAATNHGIFVRE